MIYSCPQEGCCSKFTTKFSMQRHFRSHVGIKLHICMFCNKTFTIKQYLIEHMLIHTQERPYKCKTCGKTFRQSGKLHMHRKLLRHETNEKQTPEEPYQLMTAKQLFDKYKWRAHFESGVLPLPIPSDLRDVLEEDNK